jgi:hypothetical protein
MVAFDVTLYNLVGSSNILGESAAYIFRIDDMVCFIDYLATYSRRQSNGKIIPVTGSGGQWGCGTWRFPHLLYSEVASCTC